MGDKKISELTALTSPDGAEELVVNDGGTSKKITIDNIFNQSIDVTGTVTADGLTVDGTDTVSIDTNATRAVLKLESSGNASRLAMYDSGGSTRVDSYSGSYLIRTGGLISDTFAESSTSRLNVDSNGDISFYEDTGSTAKLVWKADDERLGIGTSSPATALDVTGTVTADGLTVDAGASDALITIDAGTAGVSNADAKLQLIGSTAASGVAGYSNIYLDVPSGGKSDMYFQTAPSGGSGGQVNRLKLDGNGDISFYEDTGTTAKLFWDASAESLGIGTSSPSTALDVTGTVTADGLTVGSTDKIVFGTSDSTGIYRTNSNNDLTMQNWANASILIDSDNNDTNRYFMIGNDSQDAGTAKKIAKFDEGGDISFYEDTGTTAKFFWDASAERLGIGTSSPVRPLSVKASQEQLTLSEGDLRGATFDYQSSTGALHISTNGANARTSPQLTLDLNGDVGIGISSPASYDWANTIDLVVGNTSGSSGLSIVSSTTSGGNIAFADGTTGNERYRGYIYYDHASDYMSYWTAATERMRCDSSGNLLVGTTTTTAGNEGLVYFNGSSLRITRDAGEPLNLDRLTSDGDIAIFRKDGTTVGSISVTATSTAYNTSSDYRLKENVEPMTGSIDRLKELKPSKFNFIADADTTVDGFLAHEAQEVVPEAVSGEKDAMTTEEYEVTPAVLDDDGNVVTEAVMGEREVPEYQGIDQSKLVPLLTAALQEAVAKIETLETRITALEANQ